MVHKRPFQPLHLSQLPGEHNRGAVTDLPLNWIEKSGSDQQKIGIWGKKSGSWSNRLQKEITHPKSQLFVVSFFYSAIRNVLNCQTSSYVFFSCLFCLCVCCFCFYVCSLRPANSWLSFLTLVREYSSRNFWVIFCYFAGEEAWWTQIRLRSDLSRSIFYVMFVISDPVQRLLKIRAQD